MKSALPDFTFRTKICQYYDFSSLFFISHFGKEETARIGNTDFLLSIPTIVTYDSKMSTLNLSQSLHSQILEVIGYLWKSSKFISCGLLSGHFVLLSSLKGNSSPNLQCCQQLVYSRAISRL